MTSLTKLILSAGFLSGRANSLPGQGPSSVIAHPIHVAPSEDGSSCLIGVLEFVKNCDEDATGVDTFNLEDEEIVDSEASKQPFLRVTNTKKCFLFKNFSGFSAWGEVAIRLKMAYQREKNQKCLGDFLLNVVK